MNTKERFGMTAEEYAEFNRITRRRMREAQWDRRHRVLAALRDLAAYTMLGLFAAALVVLMAAM